MNNQKKDRADIGGRLRAARLRAHISVQEAAKAAAVQPVALEKWEKGGALPSLIEFRDLLPVYGVMACQVLFDDNPLELSPEHAAELTRAARSFSPGLRARVDYMLALVARGKEPEWDAVAPSN